MCASDQWASASKKVMTRRMFDETIAKLRVGLKRARLLQADRPCPVARTPGATGPGARDTPVRETPQCGVPLVRGGRHPATAHALGERRPGDGGEPGGGREDGLADPGGGGGIIRRVPHGQSGCVRDDGEVRGLDGREGGGRCRGQGQHRGRVDSRPEGTHRERDAEGRHRSTLGRMRGGLGMSAITRYK